MITYITTQGSKVQREGRRLIVTAENEKETLFIWKLEQLICVGNISLTQPALALLLKENIDTVFIQCNGKFLGRLTSNDPANVFLRKKQFLLTDNEKRCLEIAKPIVQTKILNQATLLARIKRTKGQAEAGEIAKSLRLIALYEVNNARSLAELRGQEGRAAKLYFSSLALGFVEDFGFTKRVRRPPTDPVNAILSFLYTVLTNRCYAAIKQVGLDPQPGILHALAYNRFSLPLDFVEEWRAMLVDALTLALFNTKALTLDDFYSPDPESLQAEEAKDPLELVVNDTLGSMSMQSEDDFQGEQNEESESLEHFKKPVFLTQTALKRVLSAFSKKMETSFFHPFAQKEMTYNQALIFQAQELKRAIEDDFYTYKPLALR